MIDNKPKISVLMPAYNTETYIKEAIESVLNQIFRDFEFIIINDGSTDSTKEIIESYKDPRIKLINHNINRGVYNSRNEAFRIACGNYIALIDSDDICFLDRFQKQVSFMSKNPEVDLIGGRVQTIDEKSKIIGIIETNYDRNIIKWFQIIKNQFINSTVFFRKELLNKIGYCNEKYFYAGDYDFFSRAIRLANTRNISEFVVQYRIHKESITGAPETYRLQQKFVSEIIFNNVKYYINLNQNDFDIFIDAIKNGEISSVKNFIKVRKLYEELFNAFIKKENFSREEIKKILPDYKEKRKSMFLWYIKCKFSKV